jgi:hypothetical protein
MGHHRTAVVFLSCLFLTLVWVGEACAQGRGAGGGFEVGQPFPELAFPSLESGRRASIADFRGKKTLLHIFASW